MRFLRKEKYGIDDLLQIMKLLRSPEGCPWDRAQTHQSIRKNFIEETYEVAEAIDNGDMALLREELGDVLLQVVFHAQMESEAGVFDFDDVCDGICKKLIVRHPHIFAEKTAQTPAEVLRNWDDIKKREKRQTTQAQVLDSVPRTLPALMRSEKVQHRAARVGFDFPDVHSALESLESELRELREALEQNNPDAVDEELGDLLFSAVNVSRFVSVDAEHSLHKACDKFAARFAQVEQLANARGLKMSREGMESLDILWREVKNKES